MPVPLIFGPAYLDVVVEIDRRLLSVEPPCLLDQSATAVRREGRNDGLVVVAGPDNGMLTFRLPADNAELAATYFLVEPLTARCASIIPASPIVGEYSVFRALTQLGGMGAGYAAALGGRLRMPVGADTVGRRVLDELARHGVDAVPAFLTDCDSDSSLVVLSAPGDKLAVGVRQAMVRWQATDEDIALAADASMLVFCGAPNHLMQDVISGAPDIPVICAPALRNVCDDAAPLAELSARIDYLALNALEWERLGGRERLRRDIPVITVTDGARGSHIFLYEEEIAIPAMAYQGPLNVNRAGETYASTFLKVLEREDPAWFRHRRVGARLAERAGRIATAQATRQLAIAGFGFPPDDWI